MEWCFLELPKYDGFIDAAKGAEAILNFMLMNLQIWKFLGGKNRMLTTSTIGICRHFSCEIEREKERKRERERESKRWIAWIMI